MTHEYKFISPSQTLEDWKAGKIQCFHNAAGKSEKLSSIMGHLFEGKFKYYKYGEGQIDYNPDLPSIPTDELYNMIKGEGKYADHQDKHYIHNTFMKNADVWTEEHDWVMTKGKFEAVIKDLDFSKINKQKYEPQEEGELVGYELNGKIAAVCVAIFLDCSTSDFPLEPKKYDGMLIKRAKDLGILSTCFNPIYKQKEVKEIQLSNGYYAVISKENVVCNNEVFTIQIPITDIQSILDAHKTL